MSILKPQKILFKELRKINNLVEEFKETDEIENITKLQKQYCRINKYNNSKGNNK